MDEQRKGMESIGQAAARLLARMDERAKKASGGFERPEKFQPAACVSPRGPMVGSAHVEKSALPTTIILAAMINTPVHNAVDH